MSVGWDSKGRINVFLGPWFFTLRWPAMFCPPFFSSPFLFRRFFPLFSAPDFPSRLSRPFLSVFLTSSRVFYMYFMCILYAFPMAFEIICSDAWLGWGNWFAAETANLATGISTIEQRARCYIRFEYGFDIFRVVCPEFLFILPFFFKARIHSINNCVSRRIKSTTNDVTIWNSVAVLLVNFL